MSSTKKILLQQIDNLINELCTTFPNFTDIILFREKFILIKSANSNVIVEYIIQHIYPLKDMILKEDESFFLSGGGQEEIKDKSGIKLRDNIKSLWVSEMSPQNKEVVWKYFKIFVLLSEKYILENVN